MSTELDRPAAYTRPTADALRRTLAAVIGCVALSIAATGHADSALRPPTIDELKRAYLLCNRTAMKGSIEFTAAMQCSILYEQLKERAFAGDFYKLLEWSMTQSSKQDTVGRSERTILDKP